MNPDAEAFEFFVQRVEIVTEPESWPCINIRAVVDPKGCTEEDFTKLPPDVLRILETGTSSWVKTVEARGEELVVRFEKNGQEQA